MADLTIKRFDDLPIPQATLGFFGPTAEAANTALAASLADPDTEVRFVMRLRDSPFGEPKVNAVAEKIMGGTGREVRYQWDGEGGDTDMAGTYDAEWEVTHADGRIQTFPTIGHHEIVIVADLDNAR